jgi:hypothetical protein
MDNTLNTFPNDVVRIGQVYKLVCKDENIKDIYIGSSINLDSRLQKHKFNTLNENSSKYHLNVYNKIRENGSWYNWKCEVLDKLQNPTRSQLIQLERMYYEENIDIATLNTVYCGRSKKETNNAWSKKNPDYWKKYRLNNIEAFKEYNDKYYNENKERLAIYYSTIIPCECGTSIRRGGLCKHKKTSKHINLMKNL